MITKGIVCVLLAASIGGTSYADIIIRTNPPGGSFSAVEVNDEWNITLSETAYGTGGTFDIYSDEDGTDIIRYIRSDVDDTLPHTVNVIKHPDDGYKVDKVREVTQNGDSDLFLNLENDNDVGTIDVASIGSLDAGGDITGNVTTDYSGAGVGYITAGGDIYGHIQSQNGRMLSVIATGDIGTSVATVNIWAKNYIAKVQATNVFADIDSKHWTTSDGSFGRLETTSGRFDGSLTAETITTVNSESGIIINGDLDADVTVTDDFDSYMHIDDNLDGDISLGSNGLVGQIIINVADGTGAWNGDVTIGGTALSPKGDYTNKLSSEIGGGAVGLARFNYYGADCDPPEGTTETSTPSSVLLRHYGPVRYVGSGMPIKIERRVITTPAEPPGSWTDVTSNFEVSISGRDVTITPKDGYSWASPFDYRIKPVTAGTASERLNCDDVDGYPAVDAYTYTFSIDV